ncbi:50S ribosomal protein L10 [Wolbachia endosymbiont of Dipetalonema caudispina]|uniref:50S ribosomal protein L10 n=1 Tax=Wolbachia endosymbiont of Dipetalonema caudispina TaxID=1812112 RepID=UPI00158DEFDF|nr:50S ribosomal protein L10 [Wolbachia endosymbiont of Dipetalonema caudispina]MCV3769669.1 50S ribosomal protein L10 [Wolbachia pipientis]QKX00903.1 50S ribosomal protein L10 [Wolbachia endosymbiont of Dipetalonema caudispina]
MKRESKNELIQNIINVFINNNFLILVNFKSINANDLLTLRNKVKSAASGMLVVKNTLVRLALEKVNKFSYLSDRFSGPVAVIYSSDIVVKTAKLIANFTDANKEKMSIICATYLNQIFTVEDFYKLAKLPSLDELYIKIMHLISYNISARLMSSINSPFIRLIRALSYYSSKK